MKMHRIALVAVVALVATFSDAIPADVVPGIVNQSDPFYQKFMTNIINEKYFKRPTVSNGTLDMGDILSKWGSAFCQTGGTNLLDVSTGPWNSVPNPHCGCRPTELTWCNYQDYGYKCTGYDSDVTLITYGQPSMTPADPFVVEEWFDNNSTQTDSTTFTRSEEVDNTYSTTMTISVAAMWSMSISVGIPLICQAHDSFSLNISVTRSETQTTTHSKTWSVSEEIKIPANSTVHVLMEVTKTVFTVPYQATVHFDGSGSSWCNDKVNGHWLWFPQPSDMFSIGSFPCHANPDGSADCTLDGTFVGVQGIAVNVNVTQCPLYTRC